MKFKIKETIKRKEILFPSTIDQLEAIWKIINNLPVTDEKTKKIKNQVFTQLKTFSTVNKKAKKILINNKIHNNSKDNK